MIEAVNEFIQEAQQRSIKPIAGDIHHFNKKISDAVRTEMFKKLGNGILTLPYLNDQQKTQMQQKMLGLQQYMNQIQERQLQFDIHINKYVQDWCAKTFQSALEVQHAGQVLVQSTFCNHKAQLASFIEKFDNLLNYSYLWKHLIHLESKYTPIEINFQQLKNIIESYGERRIVETRTTFAQASVLTSDKSVLVQIKIPDRELEQKLYETQQRLYTALEQININQDYYQLLEAHELVYGMNSMQDVKKGMDIYQQISNKKSLNSLAFAYQQGKVVPLDISEASSIYQKLIKESNDLQAKFQLGKIKFLDKQTQKEGFTLMKEAADHDHIEASLEVGLLLWKGVKLNGQYIVEPNLTLAKQYAQKGKNTARGLCDLGQIETDSQKSVEYYKQSIERGYLPAYYYLGQHYEMDHRTNEAQEIYTQGAKKQVVSCLEKLLHYQLKEALQLNVLEKYQDYLQCLATVKQSGDAFYHLGMCNIQDQQVQLTYFQLGAKLNNEKCILKLGELKMNEQTLDKLTVLDDQCAFFLLGLHYEQEGLLEEAIEYYKKSDTSEANQHLSQLFRFKNDVQLSERYQQLSTKTPRIDNESEYIQSMIMTKSRTE